MTTHFDTVAQTWDNNPIHTQRTESIANEFQKIISAEKKLTALEFGAGTGLLSVAMKDFFSEITLMDNSLQMVCVTVEKLADADIHHLKPYFFDLEKNNYLEKTFDVIFTQMALHHVIDIDKIISKFHKLLNDNGILVIADLYEEDGSFHEGNFNGHNGFNPEKLSEIIKKQGFKNIEYKQCFEIKKTNKLNSYPIFFMNAEKK